MNSPRKNAVIGPQIHLLVFDWRQNRLARGPARVAVPQSGLGTSGAPTSPGCPRNPALFRRPPALASRADEIGIMLPKRLVI
jgi:hypothetical protein